MSQDQHLRNYLMEMRGLLKETWRTIASSIKLYWYIPAVILILFAFLCINKNRSTQEFYTAKTSFNYNYLHKKFYGEQIVDLKDLLQYNKIKEVASLLNISPDAVEQLISVKAVNVYEKPLHEDLTDVKLPFYLELEFKDEQYLSDYQNGLLYYFNSNPFTSEKVTKIQDEQKKKLKLINKEVALIDTLLFHKATEYEWLNSGEDLEKVLSLLETKESERMYLNSVLVKNRAVDLLKPFYAIPVSKYDQFRQWIFTYVILGLGLAVCIPMVLFWLRSNDVD